jgi:hypothetical protein
MKTINLEHIFIYMYVYQSGFPKIIWNAGFLFTKDILNTFTKNPVLMYNNLCNMHNISHPLNNLDTILLSIIIS